MGVKYFKTENVFYISTLLMELSLGIAGLAAPLLAIELRASVFVLGALGFIASACYALSCLLFGKIADRLGYKQMVLTGCLLYAVCLFLMPASANVVQLIVLCGFGSLCLAMFWPAIEAWIGLGGQGNRLLRNIGLFNVAWGVGLTIGPLVAGALFKTGVHLPFYFACAGSLAIVVLLSFQPGRRMVKESAADPVTIMEPEMVRRNFLYVAWLANFIIWFAVGNIRYLFPKLATHLGFEAWELGVIMGWVGLAQTLMFYMLMRTNRWQYKLWPLLLGQLLGVAGLVMVWMSSTIGFFSLAFILVGSAIGVVYFSSIFYSLYGYEDKGTKSGIHETVLGLGSLLGPLVGGVLGQRYTLRTPYLLCAGMVIFGIIVQIVLLRRSKFVKSVN